MQYHKAILRPFAEPIFPSGASRMKHKFAESHKTKGVETCFTPPLLLLAVVFLVGCNISDNPTSPDVPNPDTYAMALAEIHNFNTPHALSKYGAYGQMDVVRKNLVRCERQGQQPDFVNLTMLDAQLKNSPALGRILGMESIQSCQEAYQFLEFGPDYWGLPENVGWDDGQCET